MAVAGFALGLVGDVGAYWGGHGSLNWIVQAGFLVEVTGWLLAASGQAGVVVTLALVPHLPSGQLLPLCVAFIALMGVPLLTRTPNYPERAKVDDPGALRTGSPRKS